VTDLIALIATALTLPVDVALVTLETVRPNRGNGFAASIIGAAMAIGLLIIVAKFATTKPKNRRRPPRS
jgi:hypothetical protein